MSSPVNRLSLSAASVVSAAVAALLLPTLAAVPGDAATAADGKTKSDACRPSNQVLKADDVKVAGYTREQTANATKIINAAAKAHVPERGQTIAVMTAMEASGLKNKTRSAQGSTGGAAPDATASPDASGGTDTNGEMGLFGVGSPDESVETRLDPVGSAQAFYNGLKKVESWEELTPTLAAHAVQHNLDPQAYQRYYPKAVKLVTKLTTSTGLAGLQNLAAQAQRVADCQAATVKGKFAVSVDSAYVGPIPAAELGQRALEFATNGSTGWYDRCQAFVAILDGRPYSGYATALDAWQTFVAAGVAHPVTAPDGVSPPPGAWLYYTSSSPAGHVATYLGNGQVASTDVFGVDHVGVGPASALTDGPWHLTYLGWAPPWGSS